MLQDPQNGGYYSIQSLCMSACGPHARTADKPSQSPPFPYPNLQHTHTQVYNTMSTSQSLFLARRLSSLSLTYSQKYVIRMWPQVLHPHIHCMYMYFCMRAHAHTLAYINKRESMTTRTFASINT